MSNLHASDTNSGRSLPFILEAVVERIGTTPAAIAVRAGRAEVTYVQLGIAASAIYDKLQALGVERGRIVALHFEDRFNYIPSILACIAYGVAFFPLDAQQPELRRAALIKSLAPEVVLSDIEIANYTPPVVLVNALPEETVDFAAREFSRALDGEALATVYVTSGSTGEPKAIAGHLSGVDAFVRWEIATVKASHTSRISQLGSAAFDGFLKDVFVALGAGGTVCIPENPNILINPAALAQWIEEVGITVLHMVPSTLRKLLSAVQGTIPSVQVVVLAGEPLLASDVRRCRETFSTDVRVVNLYGPTEATLTKLNYVLEPDDPIGDPIPIGRPMPNVQVCIVDESYQPLSPGREGEIVIVSPYCALVNINNERETALKFAEAPDRSPHRSYRTGDIGYQDANGDFHIVGRRDNQVKIHGGRVNLEEVEATYLANPVVVLCAVLTEEYAGETNLVSLCTTNAFVDAHDLMRFAADRLPTFMVPATTRIVESLPLTPNGKLNRPQILADFKASSIKRAKEPASSISRSVTTSKKVRRIFSNVLGADDFSDNDSFFVIGGHSLSAIEVLSKVYREFEIDIEVYSFYENSSVTLLSMRIDAELEKSEDEN